jgi:hypothetical protein
MPNTKWSCRSGAFAYEKPFRASTWAILVMMFKRDPKEAAKPLTM